MRTQTTERFELTKESKLAPDGTKLYRLKVKTSFTHKTLGLIKAGTLGGWVESLKSWQDAMGIHWTKNKHSIAEAVPPIYAEFIFRNFLQENDLLEVMCDSSQT